MVHSLDFGSFGGSSSTHNPIHAGATDGAFGDSGAAIAFGSNFVIIVRLTFLFATDAIEFHNQI